MMKVLPVFLIFSIYSLNAIFAKEEPNLDDPEVRDQIIASAAQKLDKREKANGDSLFYLPFRNVPYTGWEVRFHENGKVEELTQYKDGKLGRLSAGWYENGQKKMERYYKDDKLMSAKSWKPNGEKCPVTDLKDGNGVLASYNENGRIFLRSYLRGRQNSPNLEVVED